MSVEPASDPLFGAVKRLMEPMQRSEQLKWELVVDVAPQLPQAVISSNYHKDLFAAEFDIRAGGECAHTSCTAFGLERLALAVIHAHGPDPAAWPDPLTPSSAAPAEALQGARAAVRRLPGDPLAASR